MLLLENYQQLLNEIARLARACGRSSDSITLLPVTKNHTWEEILPLYQGGCRLFGENRLQEAAGKIAMAPKNCRWHMIGSLQRNKVKKALELFSWIHSVDTPELAQALSASAQSCEKTISVLLQVNTSGELSKHGLSPDEWRSYVRSVMRLPGLKWEGLMTIAPFVEDRARIRTCFSRLRQFRDLLQQEEGMALPHLSMGMSHDYKEAIEEGATILRIGTLLFNPNLIL